MNNKLSLYTKMLIFLFIIGGLTGRVHAGLLAPREIALVMESIIVDFDVSMISLHNSHNSGVASTGSIGYTSQVDDNGWQGQLLGSYDGIPVDISYTGNITFVGGPTNQFDISYTSNWLLDGESSTGSGTAVYTDPEFDFNIDLTDLEVSGSASVTYGVATFTISGSKDIDDGELEVSGEVSVIDLPVLDVSLASAEIGFSLNQFTGEYESQLTGAILNYIELYNETINEGTFWGDSNSMVITSNTDVIPEPSTLLLFGTGALFGLLGLGWHRWKGTRGERS